MPEEGHYSLNHFATLRLLPDFWRERPKDRQKRLDDVVAGLRQLAPAVHLYQSHPIEAGADLLVWTAVPVTAPSVPRDFFLAWAAAVKPLRPLVELPHLLWGFTRPSQYSKAQSSQEIDPFATERSTYLVMYPFTKTADWYLLKQDTRQGMMNEHMRIGKQYREISQLLLYSFGLQDQEFIVVYETEDLQLFSKLVHDLRATEARRYTAADTPLHTGVRRSLPEVLGFLA
jgi:chlorite dismutase